MDNRRDVLTAIPEEHRAKDMKMLNMDQDLPPVERVLGVEWCIQSDTFKFKIVVKDRPLTRRGILSTVSSIYDPLGIVSPVVLSAKKILRDLCRRALGWDDVIPQTVAQEWTSWLDELFHLEKCNIMRCLKPLDFGEVTTAQLHNFCDASEDGYGAVTAPAVTKCTLTGAQCFCHGKGKGGTIETCYHPTNGAHRCHHGQSH